MPFEMEFQEKIKSSYEKEAVAEIDEKTSNRIANLIIFNVITVSIGVYTTSLICVYHWGNIYLSRELAFLFSLATGIVVGIATGICFKNSLLHYLKNILLGVFYTITTHFLFLLYGDLRTYPYRIEYVIPLIVGLIPLALVLFIQNKIEQRLRAQKDISL